MSEWQTSRVTELTVPTKVNHIALHPLSTLLQAARILRSRGFDLGESGRYPGHYKLLASEDSAARAEVGHWGVREDPAARAELNSVD